MSNLTSADIAAMRLELDELRQDTARLRNQLQFANECRARGKEEIERLTAQGAQDRDRLDYLDTLPARNGWHGWCVDTEEGAVMTSVGGTIREEIDAAMREEKS